MLKSRNPSCPKCNQRFQKDTGNSTRRPLLLHCGHSICEGCILNLSRVQKSNLICPVCEKITTTTTAGSATLNPNVHINGLIHYNESSLLGEGLGQMSAAMMLKTQKSQNSAGALCNACATSEAEVRCVKCECVFCERCFDRIHSITKTLRSHKPSPLPAVDLPSDSVSKKTVICEIHNKMVEYYCQTDKLVICSTCAIMGAHRGHGIITLYEQNKLLLPELEPALMIATSVVDKVNDTVNSLKPKSTNYDKEIQQVSKKIQSSFLWLHGILQVREAAVLDEVKQAFSDASNVITLKRKELIGERLKLEDAISEGKKVLMGKDDIINGIDVLEALGEAKNIGCVIDAVTDAAPLVVYDEDQIFAESFRNYGDLITTFTPGVSLAACKETDEELISTFKERHGSLLPSETSSEVNEKTETEFVVSTVSIKSDTSGTSGYSGTGAASNKPVAPASYKPPPVKKTTRAYTSAQRQERSGGLVRVSHIINPSEFTVHRCADLYALQCFEQSLDSWCQHNSRVNTKKVVDLSTLNVGDAVGSLFDNQWGRARVMSITHTDEEAESDPSGAVIQVYYMDYGNYANVTVDKLMPLLAKHLRKPDFALHCRLDNIQPKGDHWSDDAISQFGIMVGDKDMYMSVKRELNNLLIVDLSKPNDDDVVDDRPVSVRDTLIFMELGTFYAKSIDPAITLHRQHSTMYVKKEPKGIGSRFNAIVSYITSPDSFVVQETGPEMEYLSSLMGILQAVYRKQDKKWKLDCPQIGMPCVSQYSDGLWYRAQVISLPGNKQVEVEYVDFGNRDIVPVNYLKYLDKKFVVLPAQAIKCGLAHVLPIHGDSWSIKANQIVTEKCAPDSTCSITVLDVTTNLLKVKLVVLDNGRPHIHLNSFLVNECVARSTGVCSTETLPPGSVGYPIRQTRDKTAANKGRYDNTFVKDSTKRRGYSTKPAKQAPRQPKNTENIAKKLSQKPVTSTPKEPAKQKPAVHPSVVEVITTKFYTPGYFFVQLASAPESGLNKLMEELERAYEGSPSTVLEVVVNQCFAVKCEDGKWYRAKVISVNEDTPELCEVQTLDYGFKETVSLTNTRRLTKEFLSVNRFAFACCISGIIPAGDTKWTKTACEKCIGLLKLHRQYIATKGEKKDDILPIDLNLEEEIAETALEPARKDYFSLSNRLLHIGLALKERPAHGSKSTSSKPTPETVQSEISPSTGSPSKSTEIVSPGPLTSYSPVIKVVNAKSTSAESTDTNNQTEIDKDQAEVVPLYEQGEGVIKIVEKVETEEDMLDQEEDLDKDANEDKYLNDIDPGSLDDTVVLLPAQNHTYKPYPRPWTDVFAVKPIFVDDSGVIYAQCVDQDSLNTLGQLMTDLQKYYEVDSAYARPTEWTIGQASAAYYDKDEMWCRTRVEAVQGKDLNVLYIDYGNSQFVLADNVHADVEPFVSIPQQTVTFTLANILPLNEFHGVWPELVLEYMQDQIIFTECTVEIVEYVEDGVPFKANLYLPDGESFADMMVEARYAQKSEDIMSLTKKSVTIQQFLQTCEEVST